MLQAEKMQEEKKQKKKKKNKEKKTLQLQFSLLKRLGAKFQDLVGVSIYLGIGQKREHTISTQPPPPN
jgi:hypothetical protein